MTLSAESSSRTKVDLAALADRRIFFGHRSVGRNITEGLAVVWGQTDTIRLLATREPQDVEGPAFMHHDLGRNRFPESKDQEFAAVLARGFGSEPGAIALYKYCYADVTPRTDPARLFESYRRCAEEISSRYPDLVLLHCTVPLRYTRGRWAGRLSAVLADAETKANDCRDRFNDLMRGRFAADSTLFDLALIESTCLDGSPARSRMGARHVPSLAEEWTYDGGHLNDVGKERIARLLASFLAEIVRRTETTTGRDAYHSPHTAQLHPRDS